MRVPVNELIAVLGRLDAQRAGLRVDHVYDY